MEEGGLGHASLPCKPCHLHAVVEERKMKGAIHGACDLPFYALFRSMPSAVLLGPFCRQPLILPIYLQEGE